MSSPDVSEEQPPPFEDVNNIQLVSVKDSKIQGVSVYSGRAEVTRLFTFDVKPGQNQVTITGLPSVMDQQSLRVEGRGSATIHDVTISQLEDPPATESSGTVKQLRASLSKTGKALGRARKALSSVEAYVQSLNAQHVDVAKLQAIVDSYEETAQKLDDKIATMEAEKERIEEEIRKEEEKEHSRLNPGTEESQLKLKAVIGVFAHAAGEVQVVLIYAVDRASWSAAYDIRVDMQTKEKPVTLAYKGTIMQSTGEDWADIPIKLETASPTFGVEIPSLDRWTVSVYRPVLLKSKAFGGAPAPFPSPGPGTGLLSPPSRNVGQWVSSTGSSEDGHLEDRTLDVSSRGNVTATFSVPGLMSVPSDAAAHSVTIVKLSLSADMEWVAVPKREPKVHLKAIVKNASEYTFLRGPASIYVDGSFIARTEIPPVSPEETFDCPLGLDPSIRITYPPVAKKTTQSGFMSKSRVSTFTQRITIHNTKSSPADKVKIIDQIPVSEDSAIVVKLLSPALPTSLDSRAPAGGNAANLQRAFVENKLGVKIPAPVPVADGITAQWEGVDDIASELEMDELGAEGKMGWVCAIPAQGKVNLSLQWEVSAPFKTNIVGM